MVGITFLVESEKQMWARLSGFRSREKVYSSWYFCVTWYNCCSGRKPSPHAIFIYYILSMTYRKIFKIYDSIKKGTDRRYIKSSLTEKIKRFRLVNIKGNIKWFITATSVVVISYLNLERRFIFILISYLSFIKLCINNTNS